MRASAESAATIAATLTAFLDTILPRDALSGSASDLGVPAAIVTAAKGDELYSRLVDVGCQWLDRAAEGSFSASSPQAQLTIVAWMAESPWDEVPRRFYELLRQSALELYYSRPESWAGLEITRPPQPVGYPDHWK